MTGLRLALGAAALGALGACAGAPPRPPDQTAAAVARAWTEAAGAYRLRQSALFELRGTRLPLVGVLALRPTAGWARLVALDDLGVKLFDLEVTPAAVTEHFVLPTLARYPGFGAAVGASLRRLFLDPRPGPGDAPLAGQAHRTERREGDRRIRFTFGGPEDRWLATEVVGDGEEWRATYGDYRPVGATWLPGTAVLEDRAAGYRLTLWLEEAKRTDE